jgi:hypothetical protein
VLKISSLLPVTTSRGSVQQVLFVAGGALGFFQPGLATDKRYSLCLMKYIAIAAFLFPFLAHADDVGRCFLVTCHTIGKETDDCSVKTSNLKANLPSGLSISKIRGRTVVATDNDARYDRECVQVSQLPMQISLDQGSIYGALEITGTIKATGVLRYEPSDGGEFDFIPDATAFLHNGRFFRPKFFGRLKLDQAKPHITVQPPKSLAKATCWQALATIEARDFHLLVGDSSSAGPWVQHLRLTNVRDFAACTWGGK